MFDSVIVTVRAKDAPFSVDLDIPAQEPLGELKTKLLEILRMLNERIFAGWPDINLVDARGDRLLMPEQTLEEAGIWDGAVLYVIKGRGV